MVLIWYVYDIISLSTLLQSIPSYTFIRILLTLTLHTFSSISILEATYVFLSCERRRASPSSAVRTAQVTYSTFYCYFCRRNLSTNLSKVPSYISFTFFSFNFIIYFFFNFIITVRTVQDSAFLQSLTQFPLTLLFLSLSLSLSFFLSSFLSFSFFISLSALLSLLFFLLFSLHLS